MLAYLDAARVWASRPPVAGRTATSLWRHVVAWHTAVGLGAGGGVSWRPASWSGHHELHRLDEERTLCWDVIELVDGGALAFEGNALRHCVYSYQERCRAGVSSIWSVRQRVDRAGAFGQARSVFTIEVDPRRRAIVQIRGHANRQPSGPAVAVIERWAAAQALTLEAPEHRVA